MFFEDFATKEVQRKIAALVSELESLNAEWEAAAERLG